MQVSRNCKPRNPSDSDVPHSNHTKLDPDLDTRSAPGPPGCETTSPSKTQASEIQSSETASLSLGPPNSPATHDTEGIQSPDLPKSRALASYNTPTPDRCAARLHITPQDRRTLSHIHLSGSCKIPKRGLDEGFEPEIDEESGWAPPTRRQKNKRAREFSVGVGVHPRESQARINHNKKTSKYLMVLYASLII